MTDVATRHRIVAARFGALTRGASDWSAPSPVDGWTAADVVSHLIEWFPPFLLAGSGIEWTPALKGPVAAWEQQSASVQALLDDPHNVSRTFAHPMIPSCPLPEAIDRYYTTDVLMHTWDLARATGQDDGLDDAECAALLAGMEPLDKMLRQSGQYGPKVTVADDAGGVARLMGFIGRDPSWGPVR
ncbi:maleylpyruvate isomerase family mycothiol-dependent enzyme [Branchiibius sp. NY16-3462-2]|uniref:maleylpyruvate isomerase family mycothiol-dependent enzyme n=1 Tax=Branchiibius sp. NY16-3462-2 TaxID=1807500 RepID=UPI0007917BEF|nr:maleylpyruvate isomerase family mycothiol-dependent enzyme [Branchiibius sp. NY16-3462-2]KYH43794.1 hypothetical protein AZH51_03085 [Branchiibius sp. NY16-3462-2]